MSRIGKLPIPVPAKVDVQWDGGQVKVKGPLGELHQGFRLENVKVSREADIIHITRKNETRHARAEQGMTRAILANMVTGVTQGFTKDLEIIGVGYSAEMKGKALALKLGFSHPVEFQPPDGIKIECPAPTKIKVTGADKQVVGAVAAKIRSYRPPEPYKGKGVRYANENVLRKAGKSGGK